MKVCILIKSTLTHGLGGMEVHCKNLSEGLAALGHKVAVITTAHPFGLECHEDKGIKTFYLRGTKSGTYSLSWWKKSANKFRELNSKERFDVVLSESLSASSCAKLLRKENIPYTPIMQGLTLQHIKSEYNQCASLKDYCKWGLVKIPEMLYYTLLYERNFLKRADAIIVVNNKLVNLVSEKYHINRDKTFFVYNGINIDLFKPDIEKREMMRERYKIQKDDKLILMLGVINKQKGFQIGIEAFLWGKKEIPNLKLIIAGDGPYIIDLKNIASKLSLSNEIIFSDGIKNEEAPLYYNACDLFILPTLRIEGLPFVLEEAMACGKPVIASDIGGNSSAIDNGINGILIPPNNVKLLSENIINIFTDEELYKKLAFNARSKAVAEFGIEKMIKNIIKIATDIINVKNRVSSEQGRDY